MFLKHLIAPLVLNLGTGPLPYMNQDLIRGGFKVVASDISLAMIRESSKTFSHKHLSFIIADNRNLPFDDNFFDSILAINSILPERREDVDRMLRESYRVLKKSGRFVGFFPAWETSLKTRECFGAIETLDEENFRVFETTGWQCYQTEETLYNHLKNAGFLKIMIKRVLLKSKAEIRSMKRIYNIDTRKCLMFEH
ncbi:MAG: hypothetical protein DA329_10600, partial [Candidatus Nitrosocosmicus sp.]|nr:hypothetical protein [Candidatus Nitrosocosmicus sp.]